MSPNIPASDRMRNEQDEWLSWRVEHTQILKQQTEILQAFRTDFERHDEEERKFRETWIQAGTQRDERLRQLEADHSANGTDITTLELKIDALNRRVWLNLGAVGVYAPVITYLAVKLIEHLIETK